MLVRGSWSDTQLLLISNDAAPQTGMRLRIGDDGIDHTSGEFVALNLRAG